MEKKTGIITDSNSGITEEEGKKLGVTVVPMPFMIDGVEYYEGRELSRELFYEKLREGADVKTSQPSPGILLSIWEEMLCTYDELVYIPMSSGLSSSVMTAKMLAEEYENRVFVVDNHRIACSQKISVLEALKLRKQGYGGREICERLEEHGFHTSTYIALDTLEYLKKGGRVTQAGAAIASVMQIKPILQIQGDKLDAYAKARGKKSVHEKLLRAVENDLKERFSGKETWIHGAYSCGEEEANRWKQEIEARFPEHKIIMEPLALSIGCHIGEGAIAIVCTEKLPEAKEIWKQYEW